MVTMKETFPTNTTRSVTLIVFNWDNTLFPTKALQLIRARPNQQTLTQSDYDELTALSQVVYRVLHNYISRFSSRSIRIVSAARNGWIASCLRFVRGIGSWSAIHNLLFDAVHPIETVYPQRGAAHFEAFEHVMSFKYNAFRNLIQTHRPRLFVSIGGSRAEYVASRR